MFLIDDLLMAPARGLMFVLREIGKAADVEREADKRRLMADLADLHRALDAGTLSDEDFDAKEAVLLERLDRLTETGGDDAA